MFFLSISITNDFIPSFSNHYFFTTSTRLLLIGNGPNWAALISSGTKAIIGTAIALIFSAANLNVKKV